MHAAPIVAKMPVSSHSPQMPKTAPLELKVRRGRPPVRGPRQHNALLDAVATKINLDGPGSIVLVEIGAALGLSRSSVYYYCSDAADLAQQAYLKSCELMAQDIAMAKALPAPATDQLLALLNRVLDPAHLPIAAMNDVDFLPESKRSDVHAANARNVASLMQLIESAQATGAFRWFDARLASEMLLNILSWALVSIPWLERRTDIQSRAQFIEAMCDLLLNGMVNAGVRPVTFPVTFDQIMHRQFDAFDKTQTAELKAEQIMATASRLFNLKGLDGVRLEDVSDEIGATKGAIYHHFRDKAELIEKCYQRAFNIYDLIMDTGMRLDAPPLSRSMLVMHLNAQAQLSPNAPLALQPGFGKLNRERKIEFTQRAQNLRRITSENLKRAIRDGTCRELDIDFVPEIAAGYFLGLQRWASANKSHLEMADFVVDMALHGLRTPPSAPN